MSYNLTLEVTHHHFCNILLVVQVKDTQGGRDLQRHEYQKTVITAAILEAGYHREPVRRHQVN